MWMLFNGNNLTASANNLEWNGEMWSIVNHFIPFTEQEVGAPSRFESDFMVQFLSTTNFSEESKNVLKEGRELWKAYFLHVDNKLVRDELKLNRPDVGWYQIRQALKMRNSKSDYAPVSFDDFENFYQILSNKLNFQVYSLGFLRP